MMSLEEFIDKMKCGEEIEVDKTIVFGEKFGDDVYVVYGIDSKERDNWWLREPQGVIVNNELLAEFSYLFRKILGETEACSLKEIYDKTAMMHELACKYWAGSVLKCGSRELKHISYSDIINGMDCSNQYLYDDIQTLAMGAYEYLFSSLVNGTLPLKHYWNSEHLAKFLCDESYLKKYNFEIVRNLAEAFGDVSEYADFLDAKAVIADWNRIHERYKGKNAEKEVISIVRNDFNRYKRKGIKEANLNDLVYTKNGHFGIVVDKNTVYLDNGEYCELNNCCIALADDELARTLKTVKSKLMAGYDKEKTVEQEIDLGR